MALVLPILIMVVFGIIEFARANQIRQTVKQAAYEGARVGIRRRAHRHAFDRRLRSGRARGRR